MILTNQNIYEHYRLLEDAFFTNENKSMDHYISAKVNFLINKNRQILASARILIEQERKNIILHYGEEQDNETIVVPQDKINIANKELKDLLLVEQELNITTIKLSEIEQYEFTPKQMEALFFMIEED